MFNTLTLTHFGRYEEADFTFADGINVVRGQSEAGKSTMLRGLLYAIGGVRATGLGADDLIRWGSRPAQMKVQMTLKVDGVLYTVKRAPSGAEVWFSGRSEPDVVGQSEVTDFCLRLIGTDLDGLKNLMFSTQNSMRGALEDGPAATVALIEQLADLGQVDGLISLASEKLPAGSTALIDGRIAALEQQIADLGQKTYDTTIQTEAVKSAEELLESYASQKGVVEKARTEAQAVLRERDTLRTQAEQHRRTLANLQREVQASADTLLQVRFEASREVPDPAPLRATVAEAETREQARKAYEQVKACLTLPEVYWDSSEALLTQDLSHLQSEINAAQSSLSAHETAIAVAKSQITNASNCTYCGKDVSQLPEVAERNAKLLAELDEHGKAASQLVTKLTGMKDHKTLLEGLAAESQRRHRLLSRYLDYVKIEDITVPPTVSWIGDVPGEVDVDVEALRREITKAEAAQAAKSRAAARLADLEAADAAAKARLAECEAAVPKALDEDYYAAVQLDLEGAEKELQALTGSERSTQQEISRLRTEIALIEQQAKSDEALKAQAASLLEAATKEKVEVEDNNQLIKDLRRIRPLVAERVWNMVLAAVSTYFTEMRGEDSVVTREGKSFTVNGRSIAGLSGSTKDILGLAIRMALTRTFLPQARFLVLDEPWAACDVQRSQRCLGFLQASGFDQVLLVTHEDSSEAVADHLITL